MPPLITKSEIESDLENLGLATGDMVLCHTSLSSLGWVVGGAVTLVDALINVVNAKGDPEQGGTIIMPTHSGDYSNPKYWSNPPVPQHWIEIIQNEMPPYRAEITPVKKTIGTVPECFRKYPGAFRSSHPVRSFCALGRQAEAVVKMNSYDHPHGRDSPLDFVYSNGGKILNIGVKNNTCIGFSEHLTSIHHEEIVEQSPIYRDGQRELIKWKQLDYMYTPEDRNTIYDRLIDDWAYANVGTVGQADSVIFDAYQYVEYATQWLETKYNEQ